MAAVGPGRVIELIEPPVRLHQLREAPTSSSSVELLAINPVAPLNLPIQVRAARPDAAVRDPGRLAGKRERVEPDRPIRRGLGSTRVPVRAGTVVVRLHLPDAEWERRAERRQEGQGRAVCQLRAESHHLESSAVIQRHVLVHAAAFHPIGDVLDVDLDAVARRGPVSGQQPGPLPHPVDPGDARDASEALALQVPPEPSGAIPGSPPPALEPSGHSGPDLPGVGVRPAGAIGQTQAIPRAAGVAPPSLVVGLAGDSEENAGIGGGAELLRLAEPVQALADDLFSAMVWHGSPPF